MPLGAILQKNFSEVDEMKYKKWICIVAVFSIISILEKNLFIKKEKND